jgi:acetylornithine deacetylase/succinyl-diaminopimelate desuccinylase-like protein
MNYYQENHAAFLEGLKAWLRIPSISTLSEHKPDIRRAAEFALNELRAAGLTGELIEGEGNPLVLRSGPARRASPDAAAIRPLRCAAARSAGRMEVAAV